MRSRLKKAKNFRKIHHPKSKKTLNKSSSNRLHNNSRKGYGSKRAQQVILQKLNQVIIRRPLSNSKNSQEK